MTIFNKSSLVIIISIIIIICSFSISLAEKDKNIPYFDEFCELIGEAMYINYNLLTILTNSYQKQDINAKDASSALTSILTLNSSLKKKAKIIMSSDKPSSKEKRIHDIFSLTEKSIKSFLDYINKQDEQHFDKYQKYYNLLDSKINELIKK